MRDFRPSELLFTQDSISVYFGNGKSIHDEINRIKGLWWYQRSDAIEQFLPLDVGKDKYDGKWYCNDNRRLYMFRVLEKQGYVGAIKVHQAGLRPKASNVGCHVTLRGTDDKPLPHCSCGNCSIM